MVLAAIGAEVMSAARMAEPAVVLAQRQQDSAKLWSLGALAPRLRGNRTVCPGHVP
jgi:hypothetical protein